MSKNDIEKVEQVILGIIQSKFATKIAEINVDKKDTILEDIPSDNYFNNFYEEEETSDLFIFYGIEQVETQSIGADSAETWTIFYHVFVGDSNNKKANVRPKVLRYTRALKEIINENSDKISRVCSKGEISNLTPENVEDINNNTPFYRGGIEFKITLS